MFYIKVCSDEVRYRAVSNLKYYLRKIEKAGIEVVQRCYDKEGIESFKCKIKNKDEFKKIIKILEGYFFVYWDDDDVNDCLVMCEEADEY